MLKFGCNFRARDEDDSNGNANAEVSTLPQPDVTEFVQPSSSSHLNDWPALNFKFIDQVWNSLETSKTFFNQISIEYF